MYLVNNIVRVNLGWGESVCKCSFWGGNLWGENILVVNSKFWILFDVIWIYIIRYSIVEGYRNIV